MAPGRRATRRLSRGGTPPAAPPPPNVGLDDLPDELLLQVIIWRVYSGWRRLEAAGRAATPIEWCGQHVERVACAARPRVARSLDPSNDSGSQLDTVDRVGTGVASRACRGAYKNRADVWLPYSQVPSAPSLPPPRLPPHLPLYAHTHTPLHLHPPDIRRPQFTRPRAPHSRRRGRVIWFVPFSYVRLPG